jgi:hypothetical protein
MPDTTEVTETRRGRYRSRVECGGEIHEAATTPGDPADRRSAAAGSGSRCPDIRRVERTSRSFPLRLVTSGSGGYRRDDINSAAHRLIRSFLNVEGQRRRFFDCPARHVTPLPVGRTDSRISRL